MNNQLRQHRELLDQILDLLIPANPVKRIPAAGEIGVAEFIAERADGDESIANTLNQLLANANEMSGAINPAFVTELESSHPAPFTLFLSLTYMGYYSRPEIRALVGLNSGPVHPEGYNVPNEPVSMMDKLTGPVRNRGPMYRDPASEQVSS